MNTRIIPATSENIEAAIAAAKADDHGTCGITDVVMKDGEIVGHLSIGGVPQVLLWLDRKKTNPRDSLFTMNFYESIAMRNGWKTLIVPCAEDSPLEPYLERVGYEKQGKKFSMFSKVL